ncbi:MAG: DUF3619 family protein [Rhodoferax sp.]|nr:DUF3619 family protein [Rhodoferax sp.]
MTNSIHYQAEILCDRFGLKVAGHLSRAAAALPHDVEERLRVSRQQAVAKRKIAKPAPAGYLVGTGASASLGLGDEGLSWWGRIASALPLIALAVGLITINMVQNDRVANELAAVDAALLVDDLPPAAYADPGFAQFIRVHRVEAQ